MNRQGWNELARALNKARQEIAASWPPKGGYMVNAPDSHDRKLIYFAKLDGFDQATRAMCRVLRSRSSRFDPARFLRLIGMP
jgi:hypothetical protein